MIYKERFNYKYRNDLPTMEDVSNATRKGDIKNPNGNFWKKELKKCSLDTSRRYMIETYIYKSPLWFGQRELLDCMTKRHVTLSVKSRVVGYTSLMAALTACEMVLNSDMEDKYEILYIAQSGQERSMFRNQVIEYINRIPKQLWTADFELLSTNRELCLGNSRLSVGSTNTSDIVDSTEKPKVVIYDEMVAVNNAYSYNNAYDKYLFEISDKVIIGGCANHRNENFYNFVKDYKEKYGSYVKMIWEDNPYHTDREYKMKKSYCCNVYDFSDEFDCEVFKLVKEKV